MSDSDWMRSLNDAMADLYPTVDEARRVVTCAGLRPSMIRFNDASLINWFNILQSAERQSVSRDGRPDKVAKIVQCALADYPSHDILLALQREEPPVAKGADIHWDAPEDGASLEKIIGEQSTLLPIRFLEMGTLRARSVARIVRSDRSSGTGFLIGGGWMLTNNHVLPEARAAAGAVAEFNYQETVDGTSAAIKSYELDPSRFHTSAKNDWTVVGIGKEAEREWGTIALEPAETRPHAYVNIIQHPGGGPKQIGLYHNTVAFVGKGRVQYLTDTLPGSSGSPVFDDQWRVVALHHSGGMLRQPGTKKAFYRNEGIAVASLLHELEAAGVKHG